MTQAVPRDVPGRYCLSGRVMCVGIGLRVILALRDLAADRHLWGDCFDGTPTALFELEDRVAETATRSVIAQLAAAEIERAQRKPPSALLARDLVWQAVPHLRAADLGSARRALALLERGMRADPDDALSLALAGVGHAQVLNYHGILDEDCGPHCTSSIRLANQAGVLDAADPVVATARAAVATMLLPQNEVAEALAARAVAMDPTSGWAWERRGFSRLLGGDGAERARAELQHAIHLGGPYVSRANCMAGIGRACLATGRIEEANAWTRKAVAENPAASWLYRFVVTAAVMMGDMPAARRSMRLLRDAYPGLRAAHLFPAFAAPLVEAGLPL